MNVQEIRQGGSVNFFDNSATKNIRTSFKSILADELKSLENFADSWQNTLEKYFGQPARENPSQLNPEVQRKLTATLGKHAIVIPPELNKKMEVNPALRENRI